MEHTHIFFAHAYKYQSGWKDELKRFIDGKGLILDYEFLKYENGRRILGFSEYAGFVGAGLGVLQYLQELENLDLDYFGKDEFINMIKDKLSKENQPKVLVIGYTGKCGVGSMKLLKAVGIKDENITKWRSKDTKEGGPLKCIATDYDIVINDIYLSKKIKPFLTDEVLDQCDKEESRRLSVLVDVSCDPNSNNNPFPINSEYTSFKNPVNYLRKNLGAIVIDHLPSLIPREASYEFSEKLLPLLLDINLNIDECTRKALPFIDTKNLFEAKCKEAQES